MYWIVVLVLQAHYVKYLYESDTSYKTSAANVGSHFIFVSGHKTGRVTGLTGW